jgi:hypothetical protein
MTNWTVPKLAIVEKMGKAPLTIADVMMVLMPISQVIFLWGKKRDHFVSY